MSVTHDVDEMLTILQKRLIKELKLKYPDYVDSEYLVFAMQDIFMYTNHPFVILIDEWDCLFREYKQNKDAQKKYLDFLRAWLKDKDCNGVQREHNKKLNNGLPILHKVPPKRDYGRYFCIMAEKGGTSHGGLTEKLSLFFHAKKQEVNAYGR